LALFLSFFFYLFPFFVAVVVVVAVAYTLINNLKFLLFNILVSYPKITVVVKIAAKTQKK